MTEKDREVVDVLADAKPEPDVAEDVPVNDEQPSDLPPAAPEADSLEQRQPVRPYDDPVGDAAPDDADALDVLDQHRVVDLDEDDYR